MAIKSRYVGSTLVYYDDYDFRWIKAVGPDVREWEMRFGSDFTTAIEYAVTYVDVGAGTSLFTQAITAGDRALITTAQNENDGGQLQLVGTPFALATGHPLYFGAKIAISDATQSDFIVGLANTDTTLIAAHALAVSSDGVFFYKVDGGTIIVAGAEKATAVSTVNAAAAMSTSDTIYEIYYDGVGTVTFYLDGVEVTSMSAGFPTAVLAPSFGLWAGAAAAKTGLVEWMRCIQL
jgi:hypothetical protein